MWDFAYLRDRAIAKLDGEITHDPVERVMLADQFNVPSWELDSLNQLCQRELDLTVEEGHRIGVRRTINVTTARAGYYCSYLDLCGCNNPRWQQYCRGCGRWGAEVSGTKQNDYDFRQRLQELMGPQIPSE